MRSFYFAQCELCVMNMPFESLAERKEWIQDHYEETGHAVTTYRETK